MKICSEKWICLYISLYLDHSVSFRRAGIVTGLQQMEHGADQPRGEVWHGHPGRDPRGRSLRGPQAVLHLRAGTLNVLQQFAE